MTKNKVGKIVWCLIISILVVIASMIIYVFIQTRISPNKIPSIFGYKPFIVLSGSMEKEIIKGDLVIVKEVSASKLKEKDIIAFRDKDGYVVTHRIVDIRRKNGKYQITTKGDNNGTNDSSYVLEDDVEGVYRYRMPGAGKVLLIMQQPVTLIFTLIIIIVGGFGFIMFDNCKMSSLEKKELEELRREIKKKNN